MSAPGEQIDKPDICWNCGLPQHEHRQVLGNDPPVFICPISVYEPSLAKQDRLRAMTVDQIKVTR